MDDRETQRAADELKRSRVFIVGMMKSGNPFQISLGKAPVKETAERIRKSLEKGAVEVIEGDAFVVIRWGEMESAVVMTEYEMERRQILQSVAARGRG